MALERLSVQELRSVLRSIERALECSVCLERIRQSATLCRNGHGVCKSCGTRLHECPICRQAFSDVTPSMLNSVINLMPRSCKHQDNGCDTILLPDSCSEHERLCGYRRADCRLPGCSWSGLVNDTLNHIQCDHRSLTVYHAENDGHGRKWVFAKPRVSHEAVYPVYAFNNLIWARAAITSTLNVCISFHLVPNRVAPKLLAIVSFKRGAIEYTNTVGVVETTDYDCVPKHQRIVLHADQVKLFLAPTGELVHGLKILKDGSPSKGK